MPDIIHSAMCYNETVIFRLYFKVTQSDDDFEIKSKYYSFIIVTSCFEYILGFQDGITLRNMFDFIYFFNIYVYYKGNLTKLTSF